MALAGHVLQGGAYCEDGSSPDCIPDTSEEAQEQSTKNTNGSGLPDHDTAPPETDSNLGGGLLLATLVLLLWMRMRP